MQLYDRCTKFYLVIDEVETEIREPINWASITITLKRDIKYYGVNFEFSDGSVMLNFNCNSGKSLLDALYYSKGNDAEAYLLFDELNEGSRTNLFTGKLDFNTYENKEFTTALAVKRVYFGDLLRSRADLKTTLSQMASVDGLAVQNPRFTRVELHSKTIRKNSTGIQTEAFETPITPQESLVFSIAGGGGSSSESGNMFLQIGFDTIERADLQELYFLPTQSLSDRDAWIYEAFEAGTHSIEGKLMGTIGFVCNRAIYDPIATPLACGGGGYWNEAVISARLRVFDENDNFKTAITIKEDRWTDTEPSCHDESFWYIDYNEDISWHAVNIFKALLY